MTATVRAQTWPREQAETGTESDESDGDVDPAPGCGVELENPFLGHHVELIVDQTDDPLKYAEESGQHQMIPAVTVKSYGCSSWCALPSVQEVELILKSPTRTSTGPTSMELHPILTPPV